MPPIGVGFIELDPDGIFHLQRLRLRSEFRCDVVARSATELLECPEISLVWVGSTARQSRCRAALEAGKHVLCGLPTDTANWHQVLHASRASGPRVFVSALHRNDSRLLTARSVIQSGVLGQILDYCCISRQYVPGELGVTRESASKPATPENCRVAQIESHTFEIQWFEMLDELLQLATSPPAAVQALPAGQGRAIRMTFADGTRAYLELNRRSFAPLETGWVLEGTTGGYAAGRRFRAGADYELIDVPVEPQPTDQEAFYNSLTAAIRDEGPFTVTNESILRVLELREAIESSLQTGKAVEVPPAVA